VPPRRDFTELGGKCDGTLCKGINPEVRGLLDVVGSFTTATASRRTSADLVLSYPQESLRRRISA
jgi:hypothetical protein